jgi:uncharacterized protein YggU (UPF0235/DUF167 family)
MIISAKIIAGARSESVVVRDDVYVVRVRAIREDGKANEAACTALATHFSVPKASVQLVRGHTATRKVFEIQGV